MATLQSISVAPQCDEPMVHGFLPTAPRLLTGAHSLPALSVHEPSSLLGENEDISSQKEVRASRALCHSFGGMEVTPQALRGRQGAKLGGHDLRLLLVTGRNCSLVSFLMLVAFGSGRPQLKSL